GRREPERVGMDDVQDCERRDSVPDEGAEHAPALQFPKQQSGAHDAYPGLDPNTSRSEGAHLEPLGLTRPACRASEAQKLENRRAIDGIRRQNAQPFTQRTRSLEGYLVQVGASRPVDQVFVAGTELIDEFQLQPAPREPVLARRNLIEVELRPVRLDDSLDQGVRGFW